MIDSIGESTRRSQSDCSARVLRRDQTEGSHIVIRCNCARDEGEEPVVCTTVVPDHGPKDLGAGLLRAIERDLEPCLGKGWLK
jgi:predicted RNA binding protein YcfA (HicA-like mRNA interferase family)